MAKQEFFEVPHMRLCRDDLKDLNTAKFPSKYTDKQMERIAQRLSNYLLQEWHNSLQCAVNDIDNE